MLALFDKPVTNSNPRTKSSPNSPPAPQTNPKSFSSRKRPPPSSTPSSVLTTSNVISTVVQKTFPKNLGTYTGKVLLQNPDKSLMIFWNDPTGNLSRYIDDNPGCVRMSYSEYTSLLSSNKKNLQKSSQTTNSTFSLIIQIISHLKLLPHSLLLHPLSCLNKTFRKSFHTYVTSLSLPRKHISFSTFFKYFPLKIKGFRSRSTGFVQSANEGYLEYVKEIGLSKTEEAFRVNDVERLISRFKNLQSLEGPLIIYSTSNLFTPQALSFVKKGIRSLAVRGRESNIVIKNCLKWGINNFREFVLNQFEDIEVLEILEQYVPMECIRGCVERFKNLKRLSLGGVEVGEVWRIFKGLERLEILKFRECGLCCFTKEECDSFHETFKPSDENSKPLVKCDLTSITFESCYLGLDASSPPSSSNDEDDYLKNTNSILLKTVINHFEKLKTITITGPGNDEQTPNPSPYKLRSFPTWIPDKPCRSIYLESLNVSGHDFSGEDFAQVTVGVEELEGLREINFSDNRWKGKVKKSFLYKLEGLERITMHSNDLEGSLGSSFWKSKPKLRYLDLSLNMLSGVLSSSLSFCENLCTLKLEHNEFEGAVPSEIGDCKSLKTCNLSYNSFDLSLINWRGVQTSKTLKNLDLRSNTHSINENWYKDSLFRTNGVNGVRRRMMCFAQTFKKTEKTTILVLNDTMSHHRVDGTLYKTPGPAFRSEEEVEREKRMMREVRGIKGLFPKGWKVEPKFEEGKEGKWKGFEVTCYGAEGEEVVFKTVKSAKKYLEKLKGRYEEVKILDKEEEEEMVEMEEEEEEEEEEEVEEEEVIPEKEEMKKKKKKKKFEVIAAPVVSNGPFQNNYLPSKEEIEKMTPLELSRWRAEERKQRNRASATAALDEKKKKKKKKNH
ncbi:hypothetical protein TrLO_g13802 [Triparma laevis f. longispina]|uniref:Uncharacterized protein n=1 Tax=Triparma laevis f. longispina TaxID=1714387 RepID=A0A9W7KTC7_9STRA|nr:hypothetical protein TrLO_g13802 [Triparma laevis f. longispina]